MGCGMCVCVCLSVEQMCGTGLPGVAAGGRGGGMDIH